MTLVNLIPKSLLLGNVRLAAGSMQFNERTTTVDTIDGVNILDRQIDATQLNLPQPREGVQLIVPQSVAEAMIQRNDLLMLDGITLDTGEEIRAQGLCRV